MGIKEFANVTCSSKSIVKKEPKPRPKLVFKLEAIIEKTEVLCTINGKPYRYLVDGALMPAFKLLLPHQPGQALVFLKEHCYLCEAREENP